MKFLLTHSNSDYILSLLDFSSGDMLHVPAEDQHRDEEADLSRPALRPYGITWDGENVFVANRTNLIVMDKHLNTTEVAEGVLDQNTHQMVWHDGKIIACMTRKDCIKFLDPKTLESIYYHPYEGWCKDMPSLSYDKVSLMIDSVLAKGRLVYILMSRRWGQESSIAVLDLETGLTEWVVDAKATSATGLYLGPDGIGTLCRESKSLVIRGSKVTSVPGRWVRGICGNSSELFVGSFRNGTRRNKTECISSIHRIVNGSHSHSADLAGTKVGAINEIRRIDGVDLCHRNNSTIEIEPRNVV